MRMRWSLLVVAWTVVIAAAPARAADPWDSGGSSGRTWSPPNGQVCVGFCEATGMADPLAPGMRGLLSLDTGGHASLPGATAMDGWLYTGINTVRSVPGDGDTITAAVDFDPSVSKEKIGQYTNTYWQVTLYVCAPEPWDCRTAWVHDPGTEPLTLTARFTRPGITTVQISLEARAWAWIRPPNQPIPSVTVPLPRACIPGGLGGQRCTPDRVSTPSDAPNPQGAMARIEYSVAVTNVKLTRS